MRVQAAIERSLKAQSSMLSQLRGLSVKRVKGVDELQLKHSGATFVLQPLPCTGSNSGLPACRCSAQGPPCEPDAELWANGQSNGQGDSPAGVTIRFNDARYSSVAQFSAAYEAAARADNKGSSAMDVVAAGNSSSSSSSVRDIAAQCGIDADSLQRSSAELEAELAECSAAAAAVDGAYCSSSYYDPAATAEDYYCAGEEAEEYYSNSAHARARRYEAQGDDQSALKWHQQDEKSARIALKELSAGDSPNCRAELLLERALVLVNIGVCLRRLDQFEPALSKLSKAYKLIMAHIDSSSSAAANSSSSSNDGSYSSDPVLVARAVKERERAALELGNLWFERATDLRLANSSSSSSSSNSSSSSEAKAKHSADFAQALQAALQHYSESLQLCLDAHDAAKTAAATGAATSAAAVAAQLHPSALLRAQYNTGMALCLGARWSEAAAALRACTDEYMRLNSMAAAATAAAAAGASVQLPAGVSARQLRAEVLPMLCYIPDNYNTLSRKVVQRMC
jgi:hypothetical protein